MEKPHHWGIERLLPALLPDLARENKYFIIVQLTIEIIINKYK